MGKRPLSLWKPDAQEDPRHYLMCAASLCTHVVTNEGDLCPDHQPKLSLDRSPPNHRFF